MAIPAGKGGAGKHPAHAQAVNLTTGTHVDSKGAEHKTHAGNRARIGPHTMIFTHDAPPETYMHHARHKTALHKKITAKGNPHPNALMGEIMAKIPAGRVG